MGRVAVAGVIVFVAQQPSGKQGSAEVDPEPERATSAPISASATIVNDLDAAIKGT